MTRKKERVGSSFQGYLAEQGTLRETNASALKRVLAWQLEQAMEKSQMSKSAMARAMRTSRSQLDRILDPDNDRVRLDTLVAAARTVGLKLRIDSSEWREFDDRAAEDRSVGPARRAETKARCADCWGPVMALKDRDGRWICMECRVCQRAVHGEEAGREADRMQREVEDNIPGTRVGRGAVYHEQSRFVLKCFPDMDRDKARFERRVAAARHAKPKRGWLGRREFERKNDSESSHGTPSFLFAQASALVSGMNNLPRPIPAISLSDFDFGEPQIVGVEAPTNGGPARVTAGIPAIHHKPSNGRMMERMGTAMAAGMLAAFACEVGMKAILMTRLDGYQTTHDLLTLYEALPEDSRGRLESDFAEIVDVLKAHRQSFAQWRYFEPKASEHAIAALVHTDRVWGLSKAARVIVDECTVAGLSYEIIVNASFELTTGAEGVNPRTEISVEVVGHENAIPWNEVMNSGNAG